MTVGEAVLASQRPTERKPRVLIEGRDVDLPEDASVDDRRVVECGLREDERKWFQGRRRDLEHHVMKADPNARTDAEVLVAQHAICIDPDRWADFATWRPQLPQNSGCLLLSRADVTDVAARCLETGDWLRLLVASFMWGQGKNGYGPTRLSWILDGRQGWQRLSHSEIGDRLARSVRLLHTKGAGDAYCWFRDAGHVCGLGPAFFTKVLYFVGKAVSDVPGHRPLVLDAVLAGRMRWFWTRPRCVSSGVDAARAKWFWRGPNWTPRRYRIYLAFMHRAASQLSETGPVWTPDLVELILFSKNPADRLGHP